MALQELTFEEVSSIIPYDIASYVPIVNKNEKVDRYAEQAIERHMTVPKPEDFIREEVQNVESALGEFTSYMHKINSSVENKMKRGVGNIEMAKSSILAKGLGCKTFTSYLKDHVASQDLYNESVELIKAATMGLMLLDLDTFDINFETFGRIATLDRFADLGVLSPNKADLALEVVSEACPDCVEYKRQYSNFNEGLKAEVFTIYSLLSSQELVSNYEVLKANPNEDVEGIDVVIRKRGEKSYTALYDVKKATDRFSSGVCTLCYENGQVRPYENDEYRLSLIEEYKINLNPVGRTPERTKKPVVIVRMPDNFATDDSISGIAEFDKQEYIAFLTRILNETWYITERRRKEIK